MFVAPPKRGLIYPEEKSPSGNPPKRETLDDEAKAMRTIESLQKAFLEISSMIVASRGLDTLLDLIVQESLTCLNAHRATIFYPDPSNGMMNVQCTRPSDAEYAQVGLFGEKKVAWGALEQNKSFLLKEPKDFLGFFISGTGERKITSLMCIPLSLQGKAVKSLSVVLINTAQTFDEKDLLLLSIFGNHASIAMEHSHLLAEVRKGMSLRRTYEQYLGNIQNQLQDLAKIENRPIEENIQRFLPGKEERKSSDYKSYSNALSQTFNIPIISLKGFTLNSSLQKAVGENYAANHKVVVLENSVEKIKLALAEPTRYIMEELRRIVPPKKKIEFYVASPDEVRSCFNKALNPFSINRLK